VRHSFLEARRVQDTAQGYNLNFRAPIINRKPFYCKSWCEALGSDFLSVLLWGAQTLFFRGGKKWSAIFAPRVLQNEKICAPLMSIFGTSYF